MRDPWEEFRFHYSVWENRSIHLLELGISNEAKDEFKTHWDQTYLIQKKWIENLNDLKADSAWITYLKSISSKQNATYPVSGLGYFSQGTLSDESLLPLNATEFDHISADLDFFLQSTLELKNLMETNKQALALLLDHKITKTAFSPPLRYHSLQKEWENREQKKFVREFLKTPMAFQENAFIILNQNTQFALGADEKKHLSEISLELETKMRYCIEERSRCNGMEEIVTLVRLYSIRESLNQGYYVIPKKANYDPFYYQEAEEIPEEILSEKRDESIRLFQIAKKQFLEGEGELSFRDWEKEIAKVDSLQRQKFDITHFESYPSQKGERSFLVQEEMEELTKEFATSLSLDLEKYENLVQSIYSYHIILQNCTGEIFRYHNQFYPKESERYQTLGGTVSEKTSRFSFIPFLAAFQVKSNYHVIQEKQLLSYRLQKKKQKKLSFFQDLREDFVPFSHYYQKNPYDQDFLFFTDDTVLLRPIYGITNIIWGFGNTGAGIFTSPWDKGKKFSKGIQSVLFSFPEIIFMNIRKGYFPYITEKDLPESYFQKVYE